MNIQCYHLITTGCYQRSTVKSWPSFIRYSQSSTGFRVDGVFLCSLPVRLIHLLPDGRGLTHHPGPGKQFFHCCLVYLHSACVQQLPCGDLFQCKYHIFAQNLFLLFRTSGQIFKKVSIFSPVRQNNKRGVYAISV